MDAVAELPTPSLLLDRDRMERNVGRMHSGLAALGVALRPHVKTAKCLEATSAMVRGQPGGITVSTLAEADFFLRHGFTDILYAVGIAPQRLPAIAKLAARGATMSILLDSVDAARAVAAYAGSPIGVLIEIDTGGHRAGLKSDDPTIGAIAEVLASAPSATLRGVLAHAGESYACRDINCIAATAEREQHCAVAAADFLRERGWGVDIVSIGSTPTATYARSLAGVTEVRAGTFVFQDLVMTGLGVCGMDDIAISVLTTVIGANADKGRVLVDCGWSAISRDRGTARQAVDQHYGVVCDEGGRPFDDLVVRETSQEHGEIGRRDGGPIEVAQFPVGRRLRLLPNHACATASMHDRYRVIRGDRLVETWERCRGW